MGQLTIRRLTESDTDAATPLAAKVQISEVTQNPPYMNLGLKTDMRDNYTLTKSLLSTGHCYGMFDGEKLAVICMGYVKNPDHVSVRLSFDNTYKPDSSVTSADRERVKYYLKQMDTLLCMVTDKVELYNYSNVDTTLHFRGLVVDDGYQMRGLASQLIQYVMDEALQCGVRYFYTRATNEFSARIFKKLGFEKLSELRYDEFLDNGKPVFTPPEPHNSIAVWGKCYPEQNGTY